MSLTVDTHSPPADAAALAWIPWGSRIAVPGEDHAEVWLAEVTAGGIDLMWGNFEFLTIPVGHSVELPGFAGVRCEVFETRTAPGHLAAARLALRRV